MTNLIIGKKCILRTYSAGVHFGTVLEIGFTPAGVVCLVQDDRIIHGWRGGRMTTTELSTKGIVKGRVSEAAPINLIPQVIECKPCSEEAIKTLDHERNDDE